MNLLKVCTKLHTESVKTKAPIIRIEVRFERIVSIHQCTLLSNLSFAFTSLRMYVRDRVTPVIQNAMYCTYS